MENSTPQEQSQTTTEFLNSLKFAADQLSRTVDEIEENWSMITKDPSYGFYAENLQYEKLSDHAERFGISYNTILKWNKEGLLEGAIRIGGTILVPKDCIYRSAEKIDQTKNNEDKISYEDKSVDLQWSCTTHPSKINGKSVWGHYTGDFAVDSHTMVTTDSSYENTQEIITSIMRDLNVKNTDNIEFTIISQDNHDEYNTFLKENDNTVIIQLDDYKSYPQCYKALRSINERNNQAYNIMHKMNNKKSIINSLHGSSLEKINALQHDINDILSNKIQVVVIDDVNGLLGDDHCPAEYLEKIDDEILRLLRTGRSANTFFIINGNCTVSSKNNRAKNIARYCTMKTFE